MARASPEDFVVVKVDIDTPAAELTIMEAIADRPEIAALVDEIFFEYHFWIDGMSFGWGDNVVGDVDTAVALMRRLPASGPSAYVRTSGYDSDFCLNLSKYSTAVRISKNLRVAAYARVARDTKGSIARGCNGT